MHGDFTLNPLAYRDRVSRVLAQQGRVQLDSDWNEQTESLLRFLRGLAVDVIGHHGGVNDSFQILIDDQQQVLIRWGEYYVDGIRCVNLPDVDLFDVFAGEIAQPPVVPKFGDGLKFTEQRDDFPPSGSPLDGATAPLLFYLDVFERHISSAQDDSIREVALLGPDTAARAIIVWRVRAIPSEPIDRIVAQFAAVSDSLPKEYDPYYVALNLSLRGNVLLKATAHFDAATDPCIIAPDAQYRGTENRLFRVEIHTPGDASKNQPATFKWSADNGSIVYPIRLPVEGNVVYLDSLGRDDRTKICIGDWVEVVDDEVVLTDDVQPNLFQVTDLRTSDMRVTLKGTPHAGSKLERHPILRRWATAEAPITSQPVELTDGVEVQFSVPDKTVARYRTGDYWLIPARTATGDVIWPHDANGNLAIRPHGIHHHYAPLARWAPGGRTDTKKGAPAVNKDLRWTFAQLAKAVP